MAVMLFLMTVVLFYFLIGSKFVENSTSSDIQVTAHKLKSSSIFEDGTFSALEEAALVNMSCDDLKEYLGTSKEVCVYLRDENGYVVPLTNGTHIKYGVGCSEVKVGNVTCGNNISNP